MYNYPVVNNRSENDVKHDLVYRNEFDFKKFKQNTCKSLCEVEGFLCNLNFLCKTYKLYRILKS